MFTGLVKELGEIVDIIPNVEGRVFKIKSQKLISEIQVDDSVSINGACQTAIKVDLPFFYVQAVHVTLEKTNFKKLKISEKVNLELALKFSDRLGGHLVQGHVNGVAELVSKKDFGKNVELRFKVPANLQKYIMNEGSVSLDGISLTVAEFFSETSEFTVSIIPHTIENTNLKYKSIGDFLNLEVDVIAKYIERLLTFKTHKDQGPISREWLSTKGFL